MNEDIILSINNLRKIYPVGRNLFRRPSAFVRAVNNISLTVRRGETLGLVGESGCGKTTLGRCILRLEEPTSGEVYFEGQDFLSLDRKVLRQARQNMQMVFQDPFSSIDPRQTVRAIIGEGFDIQAIFSKRERQDRIAYLIETVGLLPEHADRYPHEFSGGQRQRICVARALALQPKLVIADEPVSALDVSIQAQILNLFVELQKQFDLTYIFISHDLSVVRHISDRVAVMYLGHIVEITSSQKLFEQPFHPYTNILISSIPVPNPLKKKKRMPIEGDVPSPVNPPSGCSFHPRCLYAQEVCHSSIPKLKELELNHWVACHFPLTASHTNNFVDEQS